MYSNLILLTQAVVEGRVFGLDKQTLISIIIQLLNGIVLAVVLAFVLYKPVKRYLNNRSDTIKNKIENADITMAKANELIAEYQTKIKDIDKERLKILETARLLAIDESKVILKEAHNEANKIKKHSLDNIAADKKRLKEETRLYIIEIASLMAKRYVTQMIDNEDQDKIFEDTLAKMEETQWQN